MNRNPQLDLLRGVAVLLVILQHLKNHSLPTGHLGVNLFFVLSGFLISGLLYRDLIEHGNIEFKRFYFRRALKIYPAFYFMLFLTLLIIPSSRNPRLISELLFLQSYVPHLWGHTWSLAVEEHFYILLPPLLAVLFSKKLSHLIVPISLFLLVACTALRIITLEVIQDYDRTIKFSHLRFEALFAGVALGYLYYFKITLFNCLRSHWLLVVSTICLCTYFYLSRTTTTLSVGIGFLLSDVGCAALLLWMVNHPTIRFVFMERIGAYSYSIYLLHVFIVPLFDSPFIAVPSSIIAGIVFAEIVEFPVLKMRERFFRSTKPSSEKRSFPIQQLADSYES